MKKLLLTACLAALPVFANAGTISCSGTVEELSYHTPGSFMIRLSSMNNLVHFCSTEENWTPPGVNYVIGPDTCQQLYATFLAARVAKEQLRTMYFDGDEVPADCASWGSWKKVSIRHYKF